MRILVNRIGVGELLLNIKKLIGRRILNSNAARTIYKNYGNRINSTAILVC